MTRRKSSTPAEPEEGAYEIPPPSAIGRMPSDSSRRAESMESGYGLDLELLASDKPPRPDSANGMNAQESGHAPALESSPAPISDESPDAPKPPRALEMHQEYGLELEVLAASESDESLDAPKPPRALEVHQEYGLELEVLAASESSESPDAPEPLEEHEEAGSGVAEIVAEDSESTPAILEESETEPPREAAPFEEYGLDLELLTASESDESPDESEPSQEDDESASSMVESAAKASASGPEIPQESEPEAVANPPREEPDEPSKSPIANIGYFPLVRDARGNWRPGKGFSRSELEAAGLNLAEAARLRIRVDKRRRNAHRMNVATLEKAKNGD